MSYNYLNVRDELEIIVNNSKVGCTITVAVTKFRNFRMATPLFPSQKNQCVETQETALDLYTYRDKRQYRKHAKNNNCKQPIAKERIGKEKVLPRLQVFQTAFIKFFTNYDS